MEKISLAIHELCKTRESFVLVSLVQVRGSAPQEVGAKMLVTAQGLHYGTVGGGKIEMHAIHWAKELLKNNKQKTELKTWNLQTDIGMSCGGEVTLFFETHNPQTWSIALYGAGHVSQALCRLLQNLNCIVNVYDTRQEWLEKLPHATNILPHLSRDWHESVADLAEKTFLISITQGHAYDLPVLKEALLRVEKFSFIGVIGSEVKGRKIKAELQALGIDSSLTERIVCPLGLSIGDSTPFEIAISITAQLMHVRDQNGLSQHSKSTNNFQNMLEY